MKKGGKWRVAVNGVEGTHYDDVEQLVFSPDGKRRAYWAKRGKSWAVVLDERETATYQASGGTLHFSPDSRQFAHVAPPGDKWKLVVDGIEGKAYKRLGPILLSPDSRHLAYHAERPGEGWVIVVDGRESSGYSELWWSGPRGYELGSVTIRSFGLTFAGGNLLRGVATIGSTVSGAEVLLVEVECSRLRP